MRDDRGVLTRIDGGVLMPPKGPLAGRLGYLLGALRVIFTTQRIDALAIESAFVHVNPATALVLGQARGLPIALAAERGLPVREYAPALVKRNVVGRGRATKEQVRHMVSAQLRLSVLPPEDEADALAVAITDRRQHGVPGADVELPKTAARLQYEAALKAANSRKKR